jgi:hypothetical protein
MTAPAATWKLSGDYFESCNCDVVCPCLFSGGPQLAAMPTQGVCDVLLAFHIDSGDFGGTKLDGLNAVAAVHTPGPMGNGNWDLALYVDERAKGAQLEALQAIFGGAAGGPVGALVPLVGKVLGAKTVRIAYRKDGERRSVEMPGIASMSVGPIDATAPGAVPWVTNVSGFADSVALAKGGPGSSYTDYGMRWDNSGKNGHFAPISWSNG